MNIHNWSHDYYLKEDNYNMNIYPKASSLTDYGL